MNCSILISFHESDYLHFHAFRKGVFAHSNLPLISASGKYMEEYLEHFSNSFYNPETDPILHTIYGVCKMDVLGDVIGLLKSINYKKPDCLLVVAQQFTNDFNSLNFVAMGLDTLDLSNLDDFEWGN